MATPAAHPADSRTFRVRSVLGVDLAALVVGVLAGYGIGLMAGWDVGAESAAGMAAVVWLAAVLLSVQLLVFGSRMSVDRLGYGVMVSSIARMMIALTLGLGAYILLRPAGQVFWVSFLGAGVMVLITETWWAIRTVNGSRVISTPHKHGGA